MIRLPSSGVAHPDALTDTEGHRFGLLRGYYFDSVQLILPRLNTTLEVYIRIRYWPGCKPF